MNPVYARVLYFVLSIPLMSLPASWAGFISYDATTHMLQIDVEALCGVIAAALGTSAAIFAKWGKK